MRPQKEGLECAGATARKRQRANRVENAVHEESNSLVKSILGLNQSIFSSDDDSETMASDSSLSSSEECAKSKSETSAMFTCGAFFFLMLANYQLQVVRDSHILFVGTFLSPKLLAWTTVCSFFVAPFSKLAVKATVQETARSIQLFYRIFSGIILTCSLVSLDYPDRTTVPLWTVAFVCCFHVITQSVNILAISVLWSYSSDLVPFDQTVKYFSMFGASCTLGQAAGSMMASALLSLNVPVPYLAFSIALAFECAGRATYMAGNKLPVRLSKPKGDPKEQPPPTTSKRRAHWLTRFIASSKTLGLYFFDSYVLLIALYTLCYTSSMSLIYLTRSSIVSTLGLSLENSSGLSAQINLFTAVLTFLVQMLLSSTRFSSMIGPNLGLFLLPCISSFGFSAVLFQFGDPYVTVATFEVVRRIAAFAVVKPVRESLYSVLEREKKFAVKSVIDVFVNKGGMGLGALLFDLAAQSPNGVLFYHVYTCVCFLWTIAAVGLSFKRARFTRPKMD